MTDGTIGCDICRGEAFDAEFGRALVWQDDLWRLSTSLVASVVGFSYLEPRRHIAHITDLDGPEATSFGPTLAKVATLLRDQAGADLVYALIFGERVAHLHVNLAPHRPGDALTGGASVVDSAVPAPPPEAHRAFVERLRRAAAMSL
jgi:diadenosine tetraphosphate (Ap4A) HIT family hydrolase